MAKNEKAKRDRARARWRQRYHERYAATYNARRRERYNTDQKFREQERERSLARDRRLRETRPPRMRHRHRPRPETRMITVAGVPREVMLHHIGDLSVALGVSRETILRWEACGILPRPTYRSEAKWRLYTSDQVALLRTAFERCHVDDEGDPSLPGRQVRLKRFAQLAQKWWKKLGKTGVGDWRRAA